MADPILKVLRLLENELQVVDLSHTLAENMPTAPGLASFSHSLYRNYQSGASSCHYQLIMSEHAGTHMDAPSHFIEEGEAHYGIDDVPLKQVYGRAACIDVAGVSQCNLAQRTIEDWERDNGSLENGDIVLFRYGWDQLWYMRPDGNNIAKNWPGLEEDAVDYLLKKGIKAVGCDTPSVDAFSSATFPVHYALLENEIVIIENLNNLDKLPNFSLLMAFPLKIGLGTGSPVRAVAFVSRASPVEQKRHKK